mgnify:CR=1 FL=1
MKDKGILTGHYLQRTQLIIVFYYAGTWLTGFSRNLILS